MRRPSILPRTVVVLGLVSLFNDAASEMINPLLPLFLTATLGAGPVIVGLVEGLGQAAASVLKLWSGLLTDRGVAPRRLVISGYALSNVVRPLIGLAPGWSWVIGLRLADRAGKGLRGTPRDALMSASVGAAHRGLAFGFHRAMDHAGATLGPLLAFGLLAAGVGMRDIFLYSAIPGIALLGLLWWGVPRGPLSAPAARRTPLRWRGLHPRVRGMLVAAGLLAVAAVPDAFLILWFSGTGAALALVPLVWALAHALRALVAGISGGLSDRVGRIPVAVGGWAARVALLLLLASVDPQPLAAWGLFLAYAATTAATEPVEIALLGDFAPAEHRATTFGLYHLLTGLLALPAAFGYGLLWQWRGHAPAFITSAVLTTLAALAFLWMTRAAATQSRPAS